MPVTSGSIKKKPYKVGNLAFQLPVNAVLPAAGLPAPALPAVATRYGTHVMFPTASCRSDLAITAPTPGTESRSGLASGALAAAGDTVYLKYYDDEITSVELPCPAPGGLTLFVTDNLTGCKFFVDRIGAAGNLVVFHANTHQHTAGALADCDAQTPAAANLLDQLHTNAVADYARFGVVLNPLAECARPTYFQEGGHAERRKRQQARLPGAYAHPGAGASFMGGTTIVGVPTGATWEFWYQTWGSVDYVRPTKSIPGALVKLHWNYVHKRRVEGLAHPGTFANMKVVGHGQIF